MGAFKDMQNMSSLFNDPLMKFETEFIWESTKEQLVSELERGNYLSRFK